MKSAKFLNLMVLGLVLTLPFAGCKRSTRGITPLPQGAKVGPADPGASGILGGTGVSGGGISETPTGFPTGPGHPGWAEDREKLKAQTVYFDFDSTVVKSSEKAKVDAVAAFLKSGGLAAVKVEGHCDERGTEEYNRSLGERRALALREALIAAGIAPDRVDTISFGEDKPATSGHDEAAYKQNRRGEFVVLTPP
jgi:peptidoglycan-associated lipoprotein